MWRCRCINLFYVLLQAVAKVRLLASTVAARFTYVYYSSCIDTLIPEKLVSIPGGRAVFTCRCPAQPVDQVDWMINGSYLKDREFALNVSEIVICGIGTLAFNNVSVMNNMTTVQCEANCTGFSNNAILLLVQGKRTKKFDYYNRCWDQGIYCVLKPEGPWLGSIPSRARALLRAWGFLNTYMVDPHWSRLSNWFRGT